MDENNGVSLVDALKGVLDKNSSTLKPYTAPVTPVQPTTEQVTSPSIVSNIEPVNTTSETTLPDNTPESPTKTEEPKLVPSNTESTVVKPTIEPTITPTVKEVVQQPIINNNVIQPETETKVNPAFIEPTTETKTAESFFTPALPKTEATEFFKPENIIPEVKESKEYPTPELTSKAEPVINNITPTQVTSTELPKTVNNTKEEKVEPSKVTPVNNYYNTVNNTTPEVKQPEEKLDFTKLNQQTTSKVSDLGDKFKEFTEQKEQSPVNNTTQNFVNNITPSEDTPVAPPTKLNSENTTPTPLPPASIEPGIESSNVSNNITLDHPTLYEIANNTKHTNNLIEGLTNAMHAYARSNAAGSRTTPQPVNTPAPSFRPPLAQPGDSETMQVINTDSMISKIRGKFL
jgi:hypothetical protein